MIEVDGSCRNIGGREGKASAGAARAVRGRAVGPRCACRRESGGCAALQLIREVLVRRPVLQRALQPDSRTGQPAHPCPTNQLISFYWVSLQVKRNQSHCESEIIFCTPLSRFFKVGENNFFTTVYVHVKLNLELNPNLDDIYSPHRAKRGVGL